MWFSWIIDAGGPWAKAQPHPEVRDRTIWQMFEAERPSLVPYAGPFDRFRSTPVSPLKTCLGPVLEEAAIRATHLKDILCVMKKEGVVDFPQPTPRNKPKEGTSITWTRTDASARRVTHEGD